MSSVASSEIEAIVGLLLAVSIASERLVEIVKGTCPYLNEALTDPKKEGRRKAMLQLLAVIAGIATAFLAQPILAESLSGIKDHKMAAASIGLLASGGSAFWNAILSYLLQIKELKKQTVKAHERQNNHLPSGIFEDLNIGGEQVTSNECYDPEEK